MSEVATHRTSTSVREETTEAGIALTAGALLREARIAAGAHLESIAFSLKVPVAKIDALESDDAAAFPDTTFMRALASSVCRILRVDPAPVLALMPQTMPHRLSEQNESARPTFRDPLNSGRSSAWPKRSSRWLVVAVLLLLLGAAAVALVPPGWKLPGWLVGVFSSTARTSAPDQRDSGNNRDTPSSVPAGDTAALTSGAATTDSVDDAAGGSSVLPARPLAPELAELVSPAPQPPRLSFTARGGTWIRVVDSRGKVLLERNLKKGESIAVNDPGLLSVVVGRADVTDVRVGARARDILVDARDNVARFEVTP